MLDGMRAIDQRTAPQPAARLEAAVRDWTRHRLQWSGAALACTALVCAVLWSTALRTSAWRSELLRTGAHAVGHVRSYDVGSGKYASVYATIAVTDPSTGDTFTLEHHAHTLPYPRGGDVDVWYDPANTRHARTAYMANDNDPITIVASVGAMATLLASAQLLLLFGYGLVADRLLRSPLQPSTVTALARRRVRRADHRALLVFRDTGTAVWSMRHHSGAARTGDVVAAGRGHWRLVAWPTDGRPYLCHRPWTAAGRRAAARTVRHGGERP